MPTLWPARRLVNAAETFILDEMKKGAVYFYYEQAFDNRSGKEIYRMHIAEASADRLVIDVENVRHADSLFPRAPSSTRVRCSRSTFWIAMNRKSVWRYY